MAKEYVVFISSHAIQMIYGSCDKKDMIKVDAFQEYSLAEGAMINGVITDDTAILEVLSELHENGVKQTRLVIDSGQILVKNVQVPQLSPKELQKVTQNELADIDQSYEDLIYDYSVLQSSFDDPEKKGGEILCCGAERKLIASYLELFDAAQITVKSIDISLNALHKLTQELADLENHTYIVSILDANNVSSYLFENNHYTFSNRTRLFSERGTQAFVSEMNSNISQLIQFSKSKQSPYQIERAYFCGLDDDEEKLIFESIRNNLNMQAEQFPDSKIVYMTDPSRSKDFHLHDYVFPVGCLIRK